MTLAAISSDPAEESQQFARDYDLGFPVLSDVDGAVSRAYTGFDSADVTVPGIVVIKRDGTIAFRQIATSKDDRLNATELVAAIDRSLGTTGARVRDGFAAFERLHARVDLGGGANRDRATAHASGALLYPLHRYLLAGPWVRGDFRDGMIDLDAALALRIPLLADIAAIQLTASGGWTVVEQTGPNAAGRIGAWLALSPTWALQLDAGFGARKLSEDPVREVFVTFGLTRLVRVRE